MPTVKQTFSIHHKLPQVHIRRRRRVKIDSLSARLLHPSYSETVEPTVVTKFGGNVWSVNSFTGNDWDSLILSLKEAAICDRGVYAFLLEVQFVENTRQCVGFSSH